MSKTQDNKAWKLDKSGDYYTDLAMKEFSNRPAIINRLGYIGLYQVGEAALVDTGYYKKDSKPGEVKVKYNNDWTGKWTGKYGINSRDDFLANRMVQDIAIREYHQRIWERYLQFYQKYEGKEVEGIKLTKSGMISCAHLVGHGEMKSYIDSDGKKNERDDNQMTCADYLKGFMGYVVDYSVESYLKKQQAPEALKPTPVGQVPYSSGGTDLVKAARCAAIHNRCRQIGKEYSEKLKYPQKKDGPKMRSLPEILNSQALCHDQLLRKEKCNEVESFYVAFMNHKKEGKGNSR